MKKFVEQINLDEESDFDEFKLRIENSFINLRNNSDMKYKKATYLIGKELGEINEEIKELYKEFVTLMKNNESIINESKTISSIKEELIKIKKNKAATKDIEKTISNNKKEIKNLEAKKTLITNEIETIKKSEDYQKRIEKEL